MSFNPSDFVQEGSDIISSNQISQLNAIYLKKTEFDTSTAITSFNNDVTIGSNLICNNVSISKTEIEQLNNIDVNIKESLNNLQSNISGIFSNNQTYTGDSIYLGNNQFNSMTLTTNGITKTLNAQELSYLDNTTSNIQTQLNNKTNLILNPVNNNIVSMDINGQLKNNDVKINNDISLNTVSNNEIPSTNVLKSYVENKINNISMNTAIGRPKILYLSDIIDIPTGYETMNFIPINDPEDIESIILNNNRVLFHSYITVNPLNISKINAGLWSSYIYGYVDDATQTTRYELDLYIRTSLGVETLFLSMVSNDINNLSVNAIQFNATLNNDVNINLNDKLVIKVYGYSNANKNITLYLYHGGNIHNSFINTSIIESHNDLNGLNIGDYQHLSQIQKTKATQLSSTINDGLLSSSDWNIFNSKENFINTDNSILKYYRGDKSFQIIDKNTINLGNVDNTSDINKPISTLTQNALNLKNDLINNTTNLTVNSISDNIGNLRTSINDLSNKWYQILYVAGQFGLDVNNGYVMNKPKKTIQNALDDSNANSGVNIIILPWVYSEVVNISRQNITLASNCYEKGGLVSITGNVNITSVSSSVRLTGLSMVNLNITGNCSVYIDNCKISGSLNKSIGTGYLEVNNSSISGQLILNSNSVNNFLNNNIGGTILNNVGYNSLQCNFSNNLISGVALNLNSGIWGFSNSVIYSTSSSTNSLTANGIYLYLSNMSMLNPDNTNAKIQLVNTYYSINNTYYNKASSVFTTSTKINRIINNENMNIDTILLNNELNLNGLGSIQISELYALDGITSNIQSQLNNQISLSNNNTFTGITTFNNKVSSPQLLTNNINSNIGVGDVILNPLKNITTGSYNLCIGQDAGKNITQGNYNTILGQGSADNLTVGNNNILIGRFNDVTTGFGNTSNSIAIGTNIILRNSNLIQIGTSTETTEFDGPIKLNNTTTISGNTTISGTLNLTNSNSTAITQLSSDNSNKIATTEYVKYFSAPLKKYNFNSSQSPYTFNFGDNDYLELFISGGNVYIKTKSNYNSSVAIVVMADFVYDASNVGQFTRSFTTTLTPNGGNNGQMSNGNLFITTNGRGCNINIIDDTNNKLYRLMVIARSATSVLYYVETLI
jgi:hypothetical protein